MRPGQLIQRDRKSSWGSASSFRSRSLSPPPSSSSSFSWALLTPTFGSQPSTKPLIRRPPVLTIVMTRLEETLADFCKRLANHQMKDSAALLDASIAELSMAHASAPRGTSVATLQSEWDTFASPFLLLSGVESLYFSLAPNLVNMYTRIADDFVIVQQRLCDPFFMPQNPYYRAANSLSNSLQVLMTFCQMRIQMLGMMKDLHQNKDTEMVRKICTSLLKEVIQDSAVDPMVKAIHLELKNWMYCVQLCHALDACRYVPLVTLNDQYALDTARLSTPSMEYSLINHAKTKLPGDQKALVVAAAETKSKWFRLQAKFLRSDEPSYLPTLPCMTHSVC